MKLLYFLLICLYLSIEACPQGVASVRFENSCALNDLPLCFKYVCSNSIETDTTIVFPVAFLFEIIPEIDTFLLNYQYIYPVTYGFLALFRL